MLMKSDINPFESQETKPYKNDPRIAAMTDLVDAYQRDDIHRYESILQSNKDVLEDPFIAENIDEVTRNMRMKAVLKLITPYSRFTLDFIAKQLKISVAEVQDIVGFLITDKKMKGKINQDRGIVEVESVTDGHRTDAMTQWATSARVLWTTVLTEGDGFKTDDSSHLLGQSIGPSFSSFGGPEGGRGGSRATNGGWAKQRGAQKRAKV